MNAVKKHPQLIRLWLMLCAALVVGMVLVGGYTRLSGSGLSITEWKPIHGVIPPMGEAQWQEEFAKYREIPQYREINPDMTLEEFKQIFWPEYWHRVLGRAIGIVFLLPLIGFWASGAISNRLGVKLTFIFALGGLQGFMGWYMVSSGLIHNVYVDHMRLAAHFGLALLLLGLLIWQILAIRNPRTKKAPRLYKEWVILLCLQILYGAFTAGLHAGLLYNTYPTMNGAWIPEGLFVLSPSWINLIENHTTVQFIHRWLAALVTLSYLAIWFFFFRRGPYAKLAHAILAVIFVQFLLGVLTLLHAVPLGLGLAHQMTAVALFALSIIMLYRLGQHHD